ncbi:MAG: RNA methyltransferase [Chloroflexota bacterium]
MSARMITSPQNPLIQRIRRLQDKPRARREAGLFIVEGVRLCEEALSAGWIPHLALYTEDLSARGQVIVQQAEKMGGETHIVSGSAFRAASDTESPQGILLALPIRNLSLPADLDFILIPDMVRDPGNLGTILRTAVAAGVQAVLLPPKTADPYAPKVVRSAMGGHFHLPIHPLSWKAISKRLQDKQVYMAQARSGIPYTQADFRSPLALIVGGEARGASEQAQNLNPIRVHIPMKGMSESLNVAISAAVLMFEVARQRDW